MGHSSLPLILPSKLVGGRRLGPKMGRNSRFGM